MPTPTPEAWAQIRYAYEHTDATIDQICAEHRISSGTLRDRMRRWRWTRRRSPIPLEGPPPVLQPVIPGRGPQAANPESITPAAAYGFRARRPGEPNMCVDALTAASRNDEDNNAPPTPPAFAHAWAGDPPHRCAGGGLEQIAEGEDPATIVPRLQSAVARLLPAIEATIARLAAGPQQPRDMEQAGRALSSLTRTLRELNGLLAQHQAAVVAPGDEIPTDMIAFRMELARRLNTIIDRMQENAKEAKPEET